MKSLKERSSPDSLLVKQFKVYLTGHCFAVETLLSRPKRIDWSVIASAVILVIRQICLVWISAAVKTLSGKGQTTPAALGF